MDLLPVRTSKISHQNHRLNAGVYCQLIARHVVLKGAKKVIFGQRNGWCVPNAKKTSALYMLKSYNVINANTLLSSPPQLITFNDKTFKKVKKK